MSSKSSVRNAYIVMIAGGIAVLALVGWALNRSFEAPVSSQLPVVPQTAAPVTLTSASATIDEHTQTPEKAAVARISVEELQKRIKNGEVTVIDVRAADAYQSGHIPGALHIPMANIEAQVPYLPKAKPIVTYCT